MYVATKNIFFNAVYDCDATVTLKQVKVVKAGMNQQTQSKHKLCKV